jgi:hypothetical protein
MLWWSVYNAAAGRCLFLYIPTQNGVIPCNRDGCGRIWVFRSMVLGVFVYSYSKWRHSV